MKGSRWMREKMKWYHWLIVAGLGIAMMAWGSQAYF